MGVRNRRVLHVISSIDDGQGGPVAYLLRLLESSSIEGKSTVLTTQGRQSSARPKMAAHAHMDVLSPRGRLARRFGISWGSTRAIVQATKRTDIVIIHGLFHWLPWFAAVWARIVKKPRVIVPHGSLGASDLKKHGAAKRFLTPLWRSAIGGAEIIVISPDEHASMDCFGTKVQTHVIPPAFPLGPSLPSAEGSTLRIVFAGRIHPVKNLPALIQAVDSAGRSVHLTIMGSGETHHEAQLRTLLDQISRPERITLAGWADDHTVKQIMCTADLVALPSLSENFGMAAAESLSLGVPVLVSDQVGLSDMVASYRAGIVTTIDTHAIEQAIDQVSRKDLSEMRVAARHMVSIELSANQVRSAWETVLRTCSD